MQTLDQMVRKKQETPQTMPVVPELILLLASVKIDSPCESMAGYLLCDGPDSECHSERWFCRWASASLSLGTGLNVPFP